MVGGKKMTMGISYLKVKFQDSVKAKTAEIIGREVLDDLYMFHNEFQTIRNTDISVKDRMKNLSNKFPLVDKYFDIPIVRDSDVLLNRLAGWNEICKETTFDFYRRSNELYLLNEVWYYSYWDEICNFFGELGATETGWKGGECDGRVDLDLFERIEMRKFSI